MNLIFVGTQNKEKHPLLFNNPANTIFFLTHFLSGIVLVCFLKNQGKSQESGIKKRSIKSLC